MTNKVFDEGSGGIRVCDTMCPTCIFRPGNLMHLAEGRREALEADAVARDTWITCHDTLGPAVRGAICRGFFNWHKMNVWPLRLALGTDRIRFVSLPCTGEQLPADATDLAADIEQTAGHTGKDER